jgi:hypothetical protein
VSISGIRYSAIVSWPKPARSPRLRISACESVWQRRSTAQAASLMAAASCSRSAFTCFGVANWVGLWSGPGTAQLLGPLTLAIAMGVPITLAGARRIDVPHHTAMTVFARELREAGARVRVLDFNPPREKSLFHAKIVAGKRGYLGTGNLSIGGFEDNIEVGLPLDETDVDRVWWIVERLVEAELLVAEERT